FRRAPFVRSGRTFAPAGAGAIFDRGLVRSEAVQWPGTWTCLDPAEGGKEFNNCLAPFRTSLPHRRLASFLSTCKSVPRSAASAPIFMSSQFGHLFRISTWGESHGGGVGVVVDGCPPRIPLCEADIQADLDRRRPGQSEIVTPRDEKDECRILSGVFEGQ